MSRIRFTNLPTSTSMQERDMALEQVKELKETVSLLRKALATAEEKIRISPFVQ